MRNGEEANTAPLVGRERELMRLGELFTGGSVPAAVVTGAAGLGKSHLAARVAAKWEGEGAVVESAIGTRSAASIPFGAVAHLIPEGPGALDRLELLRSISSELRRRAGGGRAVLLVDDAHLLDPGSATLVHHAATEGTSFVLATVRSDEPCEDAIQRLWTDSGGTRLDLDPLSAEEVGAMVEEILGGPVEIRTRTAMVKRAAGNPLVVRELVVGGVESGALRKAQGVWKLEGSLPPSERLIDMLAQRMADLEGAEHKALALLAVAEPIEPEVFEALAGSDALIDLERRRLIELDEAHGRHLVRFDHPLIGDVIRSQIGTREARQLRGELAAAYAEAGRLRRGNLLRVARWQLDEDLPRDPGILGRAARAADQIFDRELAVRLAEASLESGGGYEAAMTLGTARAHLNRFAEAEKAFAPYEDEARQADAAGEYVAARVSALHVGLGRSDEARALLTRAASWSPDRAWQERLLAWEMTILFDRGEHRETVERGDALFEPGVEVTALLTAAFPVPLAHLLRGETKRSRELADLAVGPAIERTLELRETSWLALAAWVATSLETGYEWPSLEGFNEMAQDAAATWANDELTGLLDLSMGRLAINQGLMKTALARLEAAHGRIQLSDPRGMTAVTQLMIARAHATLGDLESAERSRDGAARALNRRTINWLDRVEAVRADVWIAAARGELSRAQQIALTGAAELKAMPFHVVQCLHEAIRTGAREAPLLERTIAASAEVDSSLSSAYGRHAAALLDRDGAALEAAARDFEEIGAILHAAEAAADASAAHRASGLEDSARRAGVMSRRLAEATEAARTPPLATSISDDLTPREREIAMLAARGSSNGEIAERLVLSRRTVESHLYRIYGKLGLKERDELKTLLG